MTSSSHSLLVTSDDNALSSSHVEDTVSEAESDNFHCMSHFTLITSVTLWLILSAIALSLINSDVNPLW